MKIKLDLKSISQNWRVIYHLSKKYLNKLGFNKLYLGSELKLIIISSVIIISNQFYAKSQSPNFNIIPPSPNAASIGRFGDIPLNYSSGLPDVGIPLFNLNEGSLNLPISLKYNYSGYKPYEQPSIVGMGWSLLAGGAITRVINGTADERHVGGVFGYLYSTTDIKSLLNTDGSLNCSGSNCPTGFGNGTEDGMPDMFYFTFGNTSGKFFFGDDGLPHVVSDRKIKIAYTAFNTSLLLANGEFDNIFGFTITTEDGTVYKFGDPAKTLSDFNSLFIRNVEFSYSYPDVTYNPATNASVTAWYLYEIDDTNGNSIKFTYTNDYRDSNTGTIKNIRQNSSLSPYQYFIKIAGASLINSENKGDFIHSVSSENFLTTIQGSNWQVNLNYNNLNSSTLLQTLSSISLAQTNGNIIKTYQINYTGTNANLLSTLNEMASGTSTTANTYSFNYYPLPATFYQNGLDYWGYYNGVNNAYLIPVNPYSADRTPSLTNTLCGALKTITYPTGGSTQFNYEQNEYSYIRENATYNGQIIGRQPFGGIRVKSIISSENSGNPPIEKDFYYDNLSNSSLSSGVALAPPYNYLFTFQTTISNIGFFGPLPDKTVNWQYYKSDPFYMLSRTPVYYFNVKEVDGFTTRTDHIFTSHADYPDQLGVSYGLGDNQVGQYGSYDFIRPVEKDTKYYNNGVLVKEKQTSYSFTISHQARTLWSQQFSTLSDGSFQFIKGLSTISAFVQKTSESNIDYLPQQVNNVVNYSYDPTYFVLRNQTQVNSDNKTVKKSFTYPVDYTSTAYQNMVASNIISPVIEETTTVNNNQVSHQTTNYAQFNSNIYKPSSVYFQTISGGENTLVKSITDYTANGNLDNVVDHNLLNTAYKWGYNNQYPIVKVVNASNKPTITTTQNTGNINMSLQSGPQVINIGYTGNINLKFNLSGNPTSFNFSASVAIKINGPKAYLKNVTLCSSNPSSNTCTLNVILNSLVPGAYTITITNNSVSNYNIDYNYSSIGISYPSDITSSQSVVSEFYYEGFEESTLSGVVTGKGHTGTKYYSGASFPVSWTAPSGSTRSFVISYWYLNSGGTWVYVPEVAYTPTNGVYTLSQSGATGYDDIRIYPKDAQMTTYTYTPLIGITSSTDPKGETTYYEYDAFQRLMNIRDKDNNIIKHIDYHYQGQ